MNGLRKWSKQDYCQVIMMKNKVMRKGLFPMAYRRCSMPIAFFPSFIGPAIMMRNRMMRNLQTKNLLMRKGLLPVAYRRGGMSVGFFLSFISVILFSQTFDKDNPAVYITGDASVYAAGHPEVSDREDTTNQTVKGQIYIAKDTRVSGLENLENFALRDNGTLHDADDAGPGRITSKPYKKEPQAERRTPDVCLVKSTCPGHTFFGLSADGSGFAVLGSNPVAKKFCISAKDFYSAVITFSEEKLLLCSAEGFAPLQGKQFSYDSRPPPFMIFFTA